MRSDTKLYPLPAKAYTDSTPCWPVVRLHIAAVLPALQVFTSSYQRAYVLLMQLSAAVMPPVLILYFHMTMNLWRIAWQEAEPCPCLSTTLHAVLLLMR